mmetsp:Transcript_7028/g.11092  ORF Transcript_7028/g.11092 Transcript_7028/m.11092 type:complete len:287 (+) Transcript_7028:854-1714(+)
MVNSVGSGAIDEAADVKRADLLTALSGTYKEMQQYNKAIELGLEGLVLYEKLFPKDPRTAALLTTLGHAYTHLGKFELAFDACSRAVEINIEASGYNSTESSGSMFSLAELYVKSGRYDEAILTYKRAISSLSNRTPDVFMISPLQRLSCLYFSLHMHDEAKQYGEEALDATKRCGGSDSYKSVLVASCQSILIEIYKRKGLLKEAAALRRQGPHGLVDPTFLSNVCAACFQSTDDIGKRLLKCSVCRVVRYCSKECQKVDWARHKRFCTKGLKSMPIQSFISSAK